MSRLIPRKVQSYKGIDKFAFPVYKDIGMIPYWANAVVFGVGIVAGSLIRLSAIQITFNIITVNNMIHRFIYS